VAQLLAAFCLIVCLAEPGENRRLPGMTQRLAALLTTEHERPGEFIALGNSREPPARTFFSRHTR
jgi:hypothetical protein